MYKFLSTLLIPLLFSHSLLSQTIISDGPENDIIGRICRLGPDQMIAIIERNPDWGSGDLYIKFGDINGTNWGDLYPVVIKPGNQSTHSVVVTQDDSIRVYYASDETGTYKIYSIASADGTTWVNDQQINLGWPSYQSVYDPHVIVDDNGSMVITYVKMGGGGYVAHCDTINHWDLNKTLIQNGAYRIRICKHPFLGYLATYHRNMGSSQYDVNVKTSTDLVSWSSEVQITNSGNSHDPYCGYMDLECWVYYATYKNGAYNLYRKSSADGLIWSEEEQITYDNTNNTQPAFFIDLYTKTIALNLVWTHAINYDTDNDIYFERYELTKYSEYSVNENNLEIIQTSRQNFMVNIPSGLSGVTELNVYNLVGQLVEKRIIYAKNGNIRVDMKLTNNGVYLFCIDVAGKKLSAKIFVK